VHVAAAEAGEWIEIRVSDAGSGVPAPLSGQLFERFATGHHSSGTGLGLFIVRELVRAQGGDASYELPTADRPSGTFVISLPRTATTARDDAASAFATADGPTT
jgi:signal transduction histidine kinase